jgi:hypothetical protein
MKAVIGGAAALILVTAMLCVGVVASLFGGDSTCTAAALSLAPTLSTPTSIHTSDRTWDTEQVHNAATIISVGMGMSVPERGWIIALAAAMQESQLVNLPNLGDANNADSLGLFQQRPSQGWGTPDQIMDPVYASTKFYQHLLAVPGWQTMTVTQAAQAVQRSAFPDAYSTWEPDATRLVAAVGSGNWRAIPGDLAQCPVNCPRLLNTGEQSSPDPGCLRGIAVLGRAETWLTGWHGGPVPYLSSADPATWFGGYRRDCSGYVSMALGLPGPGLDTGGLAARSMPIPKTALHAGDLLINPARDLAGHVVIFDHWVDPRMSSYVGYEQSGDSGTHHRVIPYPYFGGYQMSPYRVS